MSQQTVVINIDLSDIVKKVIEALTNQLLAKEELLHREITQAEHRGAIAKNG
jgi:hypothetical protein